MKTPGHDRLVNWLVWSLVVIGLLVVVVPLLLGNWTLSKLNQGRQEQVAEELYLRQLLVGAQERVKMTRGGFGDLLRGEPDVAPQLNPASPFIEFARGLQKTDPHLELASFRVELQESAEELEQLGGRAVDWHRRFVPVIADIRQERSLNEVRSVLHRLRADIKEFQGRARLEDATEILRWRQAGKPAQGHAAAALIERLTERQSRLLDDVLTEQRDLALLAEELNNEGHIDHLVDLRDNRFKPSMARLARTLRLLANIPSIPPGLSPEVERELRYSLFGQGSRLDEESQSIQLGEGGLYPLRAEYLRLQKERAELQSALDAKLHHIEALYLRLTDLAGKRSQALAQQTEITLAEVLADHLWLGVMSVMVFVALGVAISRLLRHQVTALAQLQRQHQLILDSAGEGIFGIDRAGNISFVNPAGAGMVGWQPDELLGKALHETLHHSRPDGTNFPRQECPMLKILAHSSVKVGQETFWRKDGSMLPIEYVSAPLNNDSGEMEGAVVMLQDITLRRQYEQELQEEKARLQLLAHYDTLTNIPNRLLFQDRLEHAMAKARRTGNQVALFFLDLDRFKKINDSLGHQMGDMVLRSVADALQDVIRDADTLARLGGDEFTVILESIDTPQQAVMVAQKIIEIIAKPVEIQQHTLHLTTSIGISVFPHDGKTVEELMKAADVAMYQAKEEGRNGYRFYTPEMNARSGELMIMENRLRQSLALNQLELHYQPQFDLESGRIVAAEALLRWRHPEVGMISPVDFIPIAEETGMILPIGEWVLRQACAQAVIWGEQGGDAVRVAVNVSSRQFLCSDVVGTVRQALAETGLTPTRLELELTESIILNNVDLAVRTMQELNDMGVQLAIDDFGTGYSSLNYLQQFPIQRLKIDRSFIQEVTSTPKGAGIAGAIIALAKELHMEVVAEGIETKEQLCFLQERGCDCGQGYFLARPEPDLDPSRLNSARHIDPTPLRACGGR